MKNHRVPIAAAALAAFAATVSSGQAGSNLNSSKSNAFKVVETAAEEAACVKAGGTVVTRDGKKVCAMPGSNSRSSRRRY